MITITLGYRSGGETFVGCKRKAWWM